MKYRRTSRFLAMVLLVAMLLTLMPTVALAEGDETQTWTEVAFEDITSEDVIAITMKVGTDYYVLPSATTGSTTQPMALSVTVDGAAMDPGQKTASDIGWTVTPVDGGYNIVNFQNNKLYVTNNNNGVRISNPNNSNSAVWNLDGKYLSASDGTNTRYLGVYNKIDWRCYKTNTGTSNIAGQEVGFWKLSGGSEIPEPTETPLSSIAQALAGANGTTFKVEGVVTLVDGKNIYIQDGTGGICLYFGEAPTDLSLGDTVVGTGSRTAYKGLPELNVVSYKKSEGMTLTAKTTTLNAITEEDICTYVHIEGLTVTEIDGNNTTVSDGNGHELPIFKAVSNPALKVGDQLNFTGAVGIYNTIQLRNTLASEIEILGSAAPAAPTADVPAGTVEAGTQVTFSCATEGAVISYSTDNGANWIEGSNFTVTETVTLLVRAALDGVNSPVSSFTYTVESGEQPSTVALPLLEAAPAEGDKLVIYNIESGVVLSLNDFFYNNSKHELEPVTATLGADGKLSPGEGYAYLTVHVDEAGKYSFVNQNGLYLLVDGTHVQFVETPGDNTLFQLEEADGGYYVKCDTAQYNGNAQYLQYYRNYFTCYSLNGNYPGRYKVAFYGEAAPLPNVDPVSGLKTGDKVAIFNDASNVAVSASANGTKLSSAAAVLNADGTITGTGIALFTVTVNDDGQLLFASEDGKYLTTGETGGSLTLEANAGNFSLWFAEKANDGLFYLKSANAAYNGNAQYLEYYNSLFTTYKKSASANSGPYAMSFRQLASGGDDPTPGGNTYGLTGTLNDGDTVILYNAKNGMALGNSLSSYKIAGVAVTPVNGVITTDDTAVAWTVTKNADGTYTFTQGDYTLGGVVSGTYKNLVVSDAAYTKWTLSGPDASDFNYYAYLDGMDAGNYEHVYLEYYKGYTLYGQNASALNKDAFGITFYKQGAAAETPSGGGDDPTPGDISVGTLVTDLGQLTDGATVLIYSPTHKTAANSNSSGDWYISANSVTDSFTADLVWTVARNADGTFRFSNGERVLSAWLSENNGNTYVELTINPNYNEETVSTWNVASCNPATHTWFISSSSLQVDGKTCYMQAYTKNSAELFSGRANNSPTEADYGLQFYLVDPNDASAVVDDGVWDKVLNKGSSYVVYSGSAEGVFGIPTDMKIALTNVPATIESGKAVVSNGALVLTVADNPGRYYIFETGGKYLAANDKEDLVLQDEADEYAKWYLASNGSGYTIYNKTAKYNGTPVAIEFFSGNYSGWTFKSNDAEIFRFLFYPLADGTAVINGVAQVPLVLFNCVDTRYIEQDYEVAFTLDDLAPEISQISVTYTIGDVTKTVEEMSFENKTGAFILPAQVLDAGGPISSFTLRVSVTNSYGLSYEGTKTVTVLDEPFIGTLTPAANFQTGDEKRPVISARIGNVGKDATFTMTVNGQSVDAVYDDGILSWQAEENMEDGRFAVIVTVTRADGKSAQKQWSFYVGQAAERLYFGQLHSHTQYSDGSGTLDAALEYIASFLPNDNLQFVAFTDHSNYFDTTSAANPEAGLYDTTQMTAASLNIWNEYKAKIAAFNAAHTDIIAIGGFEMTWSGGPGHINTFNTPGIVSRNNKTLNDKTNDAGMKAYYALLDNEALVDSLSQFNHPGKTFGTFSDFAYWDPVTDSRIFLVEVGNGEGQIGAGGYYPSYEEYIKALDKGWHVGPSNNQDNHKGRWGNANNARDVILTDNFTEQGIYEAIRNYRIYATEDKNLELHYTVNGEKLGHIFTEVPEELNFVVTLYDPDASDSFSKVELVANSGKVVHTWSDAGELASGLLEVTLPPTYSYYFVRVTQKDSDLAVTAPVWVGESLKLGISSVECGTSTPVTGEEFTLTTTFFNSESAAALIKSVTYTTNGSEVLATDFEAGSVPAGSTKTVEFKYTPDKAKMMTIKVTAVLELNGEDYEFSKDITLEIKDSDKLVYIGIDASHYNEYIAGAYPDAMGNFGALAGEYGVRTVELRTSEELIAACSNEKFAALIFTAPSRRLAAAQSDPRSYSEDELAAVAAFNAAGGQVIVCGWADYYENYDSVRTAKQMAETQNELLAALGSSLRLGDDTVEDNALNGGDSNRRLYMDAFNYDSYLMEGVIVDPEHPNDRNYSEVYSNYGGCSVYFTGSGVPASVMPVVYGHDTTFTADEDSDGRINQLVYPCGDAGNRVVVMASEQLEGKGLIIAAGAAFMSNFEVQAKASDGSSDADREKNYANYKICENLVKGFNELEISTISAVQAEEEAGIIFTIEGVVTSNASGYDKDTAFFDCIYVQDETAGVCCFPVAGEYKIGDLVRITGYTDEYQGEMELQVMSIQKLGETDPVEPKVVTSTQIKDLSYLGSLVTLKGTVESFEYENDLIQTIMVKDDNGVLARVFIDGYITTAEDVKDLAVGCRIEATGLSSYDNTWKDTEYFPRIRVRNRADIVCTALVPADPAKIYGKSLALNGLISLNFYVELPDAVVEDEGATVTLSSGDDVRTFSVSEAKTYKVSGKTLYQFKVDLMISHLIDSWTLHVYDGQGQLVPLLDALSNDITKTGSVYKAQDYIEYVVANYEDGSLRDLVKAMSDLGSMAQLQFNYDVENRPDLKCDLSGVTVETLARFAPELTSEGSDISYAGSSLLLEENTTIRHYFTVSGDIGDFTFTVDGKKLTPQEKDGKYYVEIPGVSSTELSKSFLLKVSSGDSELITLEYSALSYAYLVLAMEEEGKTPETYPDLARALFLYSQKAEAFFKKT